MPQERGLHPPGYLLLRTFPRLAPEVIATGLPPVSICRSIRQPLSAADERLVGKVLTKSLGAFHGSVPGGRGPASASMHPGPAPPRVHGPRGPDAEHGRLLALAHTRSGSRASNASPNGPLSHTQPRRATRLRTGPTPVAPVGTPAAHVRAEQWRCPPLRPKPHCANAAATTLPQPRALVRRRCRTHNTTHTT